MPRLRRWNEAEQARPGGKVEGTAFRLLPGIFDAVPLHGWGRRAELACGEIFQGAEASVEFGGRQAALAVESAQKIRDRTVALARVAFDTAGNQVAVGIASQAHAWHNVVEALHGGSGETRSRAPGRAGINSARPLQGAEARRIQK